MCLKNGTYVSGLPVLRDQDVRSLLAHDIDRRRNEQSGDVGKHRCVDDAQAGDAPDPEITVQHRVRIVVGSDTRCPARMVAPRLLFHERRQLVVTDEIAAGQNLVGAEPRTVLDVRRRTMGFVSQFLRVIPRVATVDVVAEPLLRLGADPAEARDRAEFLLALLNIPQRLWQLPPATFSGGEQQRVNIARSLIVDYPILLLDEPTASLDADNRDRVVELIGQRRDAGSALVGIFHDVGVRELLANRVFEVTP